MTDPKNKIGSKWTKEEEARLLQEVKSLPLTKIAEMHGRTVTGIHSRLCVVGAKMVIEGKKLEEAMAVTQVCKSDIEKQLEKEVQKKPKVELKEKEITLVELKNQMNRIEAKLDLLLATLAINRLP